LFPTPAGGTVLRWAAADVFLKNSEGEKIYFECEDLEFYVVGELLATIKVVNTKTETGEFIFYSEETSVGANFNATILVMNVADLYGWLLKLKYNATLLAARVIQPSENSTYVFYGKENNINITLDNENGTISIYNMLHEPEEPFSGNGLLAIIEFEILLAPPNEIKELKCDLTIEEAECFNGISWEKVNMESGKYLFKYGKPAEEGEDTDITVVTIKEYWPHIVGSVVGIVLIFVALKKITEKRKEILLKRELEEELEG